MIFYGATADAEAYGNYLTRMAGDYQVHDLKLSPRQNFNGIHQYFGFPYEADWKAGAPWLSRMYVAF